MVFVICIDVVTFIKIEKSKSSCIHYQGCLDKAAQLNANMNTDDLSFAFVLISITTNEASTTNSGGNEIIINFMLLSLCIFASNPKY